ncbi:hypothetical protein OOK48_00270 [Streptomyces viridodiastaticus]|uniref:hypothetical protein n=1 Tax=Streptomyces albogriseolus TaxID=1887 RepID=UPI00225BD136|nr:hypothetical protein [Streptomyces viridodiastaticus]MCX4564789.1 hypothetical protein [Streptomyces viridodiastaticus]
MEITKSARWGRSGRWRAGLAVAGVAAIGAASLLGPGTTAEAMGAGGGDVRSRLQRDRDIGNLAAADLGQITRAIKRRLKQIQYRPDLVDGCLTGTGLIMDG